MLKKFYKDFGLRSSLKNEQRRFVNRINQTVFDWIAQGFLRTPYEVIFPRICHELGINANDEIAKANIYSYAQEIVPNLRTLTHEDFQKTLEVLRCVHLILSDDREQQAHIGSMVEIAISKSIIDLGIKWKDGSLYPSGAGVLDERLLEEPLGYLADFKNESMNFRAAITGFLQKDYQKVIGNCHLCCEGLAKKILGNDASLHNNKNALLSKIKLGRQWASILGSYIDYADDYARHASEVRNRIDPCEAEAFLYMTGLLVRLLVQARSDS